MSLFKVFNVAGSALNAQTIRLNTTASRAFFSRIPIASIC